MVPSEKLILQTGDEAANGNGDTSAVIKNDDKEKAASGITNTNTNGNGNAILDPAKMQEMMNPQTMKLYLSQVRSTLQVTSEIDKTGPN